MNQSIGVGLIGANPDYSWAAFSHLPAIAALPEYSLRAVSTSQSESAQAAGEKYGVSSYTDNQALIDRSDVDLVVVSVKVPFHRQLVTAALERGKHVYCEWPLGNGLNEALQLTDLARTKKVVAVTGLQARTSPLVNYLRDLIKQGYIGDVLSTSVVGTSPVYGSSITPNNAYMLDKSNGANMLTVQIGHLLDAMCYCLGELDQLQASFATVRKEVDVVGTGQRMTVSAPDQIAISGQLQNNAMVSVHIRGGHSRGTNFLWEINGTEGDLQVTGGNCHLSTDDSGPAALFGGQADSKTLAPLPVPAQYRWTPPHIPDGPQFNVSQLYTLLARDIREGTKTAPSFNVAVQRHRMIEAVDASATSGVRQTYEVQ